MDERETTNRRTVQELVDGLNVKRVDVMDEVFHDDAVMDWPQSGERIEGAANRREVYSRMPGLPSIAPRRMLSSGDLVVLEADLDYGSGITNTVFIFEMRDGKIARETAYWAQPFEAPAWRAPWVTHSGEPAAAG